MKRGLRQKSVARSLSRENAPTCSPFLRCQGFTLVELLVVLAIVSIVMGGIYTVFIRSNRVYISQEEVVAAQQEARSALDILGREIRMAGFIADHNKKGQPDQIYAPAWAGNADSAIEIAEVDDTGKTTTLAFKSNLDGADTDLDGNHDTEAVRYVYYHSDHPDPSRQNTLTREVLTWNGGWSDPSGENAKVFLENIQDLTLTYQMADGTTSANPTNLEDIRGVVIGITAQTSIAVEPFEGGKDIRTRQLISNIQIRNLGLS
jgi:prepilin-type N-terminal cleavage/methylation domain-containing protein